MTMCTVQNNYIHMSLYQCFCSFQTVCCNTYSRSTKQSSLCVFCRIRILNLFFDIFDCD